MVHVKTPGFALGLSTSWGGERKDGWEKAKSPLWPMDYTEMVWMKILAPL